MSSKVTNRLRHRLREAMLRRRRRLRRWYWRFFLAQLGEGTILYGPIAVTSPQVVSIGSHCTLNRGLIINALASVTIGDYVRISSGVTINSASLDSSAPPERRPHTQAPVTIERGAWIGAGAIINPGVTIGAGAAVGAGSVVLKDVPPNTLVFGVPARAVREITP